MNDVRPIKQKVQVVVKNLRSSWETGAVRQFTASSKAHKLLGHDAAVSAVKLGQAAFLCRLRPQRVHLTHRRRTSSNRLKT